MRTETIRRPGGFALRIVERLACVRADEQTRARGAALYERHGLATGPVPTRRRCVCGASTRSSTGLCGACRNAR